MEVTVSHVVENYYFHYIYMTESLGQLYGETPEYNEILTVNEADDEAFEEQFQERYMKEDGVLNVSFIGSISGSCRRYVKEHEYCDLCACYCGGTSCFYRSV